MHLSTLIPRSPHEALGDVGRKPLQVLGRFEKTTPHGLDGVRVMMSLWWSLLGTAGSCGNLVTCITASRQVYLDQGGQENAEVHLSSEHSSCFGPHAAEKTLLASSWTGHGGFDLNLAKDRLLWVCVRHFCCSHDCSKALGLVGGRSSL